MSRRAWATVLGLLIMVGDALTKALVHLNLPHVSQVPPVYPYGGIPIFENILGVQFSISHMTNTGAAWGAFGEYPLALLAFRSFLVLLLVLYFFFRAPENHVIPLVLIISGALGNIIDMAVYGHVVDMLQFKFGSYHYPWFNIADTSICIGVVWLAALTLAKPSSSSLTP